MSENQKALEELTPAPEESTYVVHARKYPWRVSDHNGTIIGFHGNSTDAVKFARSKTHTTLVMKVEHVIEPRTEVTQTKIG